eukprot:TRINITY_DN1435_c0_g3_i8.p1 TRINITY_DN1435_c0_g3~~TRINITY_DN1435_c0_g3_i8.p1  ORF type:complete len:897 (+),score=41.08 TRINITY_DN1435_c0_g3_i8:211-2901(+)
MDDLPDADVYQQVYRNLLDEKQNFGSLSRFERFISVKIGNESPKRPRINTARVNKSPQAIANHRRIGSDQPLIGLAHPNIRDEDNNDLNYEASPTPSNRRRFFIKGFHMRKPGSIDKKTGSSMKLKLNLRYSGGFGGADSALSTTHRMTASHCFGGGPFTRTSRQASTRLLNHSTKSSVFMGDESQDPTRDVNTRYHNLAASDYGFEDMKSSQEDLKFKKLKTIKINLKDALEEPFSWMATPRGLQDMRGGFNNFMTPAHRYFPSAGADFNIPKRTFPFSAEQRRHIKRIREGSMKKTSERERSSDAKSQSSTIMNSNPSGVGAFSLKFSAAISNIAKKMVETSYSQTRNDTASNSARSFVKIYEGIFPDWLKKRDDFTAVYKKQQEEARKFIPRVCDKASNSRTYEEKLYIAGWLKRLVFFKNLPNVVLLDLASKLSNRNYKENDILFRQGEEADKIIVVYDGEVIEYYGGNFVTVVKNDTVIGKEAFENATFRSRTYKARTETCCICLTRYDYAQTISNYVNQEKLQFVKFVEKLSFFRQFHADKIEQICGFMSGKFFSADDVIYNPGEQADYLYILKSGKLRKETAVSTERENKWPIAAKKWKVNTILKTTLVSNVINPGTIFGDYEIVNLKPRADKIIALEDSFVLYVNRSRFFEVFDSDDIAKIRGFYETKPEIYSDPQFCAINEDKQRKADMSRLLDAASLSVRQSSPSELERRRRKLTPVLSSIESRMSKLKNDTKTIKINKIQKVISSIYESQITGSSLVFTTTNECITLDSTSFYIVEILWRYTQQFSSQQRLRFLRRFLIVYRENGIWFCSCNIRRKFIFACIISYLFWVFQILMMSSMHTIHQHKEPISPRLQYTSFTQLLLNARQHAILKTMNGCSYHVIKNGV